MLFAGKRYISEAATPLLMREERRGQTRTRTRAGTGRARALLGAGGEGLLLTLQPAAATRRALAPAPPGL